MPAAVIASALFVSHSLVRYWMVVLRVDPIGLALTLAGLWVFLRFPRWWPVSIVLFTAAIFTKPTFIAAPFACLLSLLMAKQFRKATSFAATGIALGAAALLVMQVWTHGAFWFDVFRTHPDPWRFSHYELMFHYLVYGDPVLILIGIIAFGSLLLDRKFDLLTLYAICVTGTTVTAGKVGSNDNHLLELTAVLCILSSAGLAKWVRGAVPARVGAYAACVLLAAWLVLQLRFAPATTPEPGCSLAYDTVRQSPSERILSEDVGALVLAGKPVWVSNPFVYGQLISSGEWSDEAVASRIRSHWFDLILLSEDATRYTDRWSPALRQDILANYHLAGRFACEGAKAAYVPNSEDQPRSGGPDDIR